VFSIKIIVRDKENFWTKAIIYKKLKSLWIKKSCEHIESERTGDLLLLSFLTIVNICSLNKSGNKGEKK
jgi:hypothetical protein